MSTMQCVISVTRFLYIRSQCLSIGSMRHYPRWSHRRPAGVVEDDNFQDDLEQWKLRTEREIVRDSRSKSFNLGADTTVTELNHVSNFPILEENETNESHRKHGRNSATHQKSDWKENIETDYKYSVKKPNKLYAVDRGESVLKRESSLKNFSFKMEKEWKCEEKKPNHLTLEKRKIYDVKEVDKAKRHKELAEALGVPVFTDLGIEDRILSNYVSNIKSKKKRDVTTKGLLEGKRLIRDAVDAGVIPEAVFFSRIKDLKDLNLPHDGVKVFKLTYKKLSMWSDVTTTSGVMAIVKIPDTSKERPSFLPLTVICDNVRDPGNMGTILRTCAGVGCKEVILTKGCVDIWEPKVLRAGAGAHFRLRIIQAKSWDAIMDDTSGSIACIAENHIIRPSSKVDSSGTTDENTNVLRSEDDDEEPCAQVQPPVLPYYSFDYASFPGVALIIGGETEGISLEAYNFVSDKGGVCLNIPMDNSVESLNTGTALGIIAFEMRKQFLCKVNTSNSEVRENDGDDLLHSKTNVLNV